MALVNSARTGQSVAVLGEDDVHGGTRVVRVSSKASMRLVVGGLLLLAACGSTGGKVAAPAQWRFEPTGGFGFVLDDQIVSVGPREDGGLQSWVSTEGGPFEAQVPLERELKGLNVTEAVVGHGQVLVFGDDDGYEPSVFSSTDGRTWRELGGIGLDGPAGVGAATATDEGFVAVGTRRIGPDPDVPPTEAVAWRSVDGEAWTSLVLPGPEGHGLAADVVSVGDTVLVSGSAGRNSLWRSLDGGATWEISTVEVDGFDGLFVIGWLAAIGDVVVGVGTSIDNSEPLIVRSGDSGRTWKRVPLDPAMTAGLELWGIDSGFSGFFVRAERFLDAFQDAEYCYADIEACREWSAPRLLHGTTGEEWSQIDLPAGPPVGFLGPVVSASHATVVFGSVANEDGGGVWFWPTDDGPLPTVRPEPPPATDEPTAAYGGTIELGVRYRYPLGTHCGIEWLGVFNGLTWHLRGPDPLAVLGQAPAHWPTARQALFGYVTLVADTIEYSLPSGEVIATYEPTPQEPPACA
jgi:hypothetical protein